MGKFFTVDIKPTITASKQHLGAFDDGDVLFNWTAFNVPKGANRLIDAAFIIRGTDGATQTFASTLLFAKTLNGNAPDSLGTIHATADGFSPENLRHKTVLECIKDSTMKMYPQEIFDTFSSEEVDDSKTTVLQYELDETQIDVADRVRPTADRTAILKKGQR